MSDVEQTTENTEADQTAETQGQAQDTTTEQASDTAEQATTEQTASDVVAEVKTDFEKGYEFVKAGVEKFGAEAEADLVEFVKKYL